VTVVWTIHGTNTAAASPLPATGVKLELRGITVWRIVDGRILAIGMDRLSTHFELSQVVDQLKCNFSEFFAQRCFLSGWLAEVSQAVAFMLDCQRISSHW